MNNFATIKPIAKYEKVAYFSVCINDNEKSLFELFLEKHTVKNKKKLDHILNWIKEIGTKYGAKQDLFRPEAEIADASALPPKGKNRKPQYHEDGETRGNRLRLYCLRANDHVVFLFNGDVKTLLNPKLCPNVRSHFILANKLAKTIDEAFINKDILWNGDGTQIIFEDDLILNF